MNIFLNGNPQQCDENTDLPQLLDRFQLSAQRIAVEVNGELVPRSEHAQRHLCEGDRVEVIQAVGGG